MSLAALVLTQGQTLYVSPARATIRTSPAIVEDNVLDVLPRGTQVKVIDRQGS